MFFLKIVASAGESGRGFAVVAKEAISSSNIIKQQMDAVEKIDTAFKTIFEGVDKIDNPKKLRSKLENIIQS